MCVRRVEFIEKKIKTFLDVGLLGGNKKLLWVNPDCGLKTREWSQVGLTLQCANDHPSSALSSLPLQSAANLRALGARIHVVLVMVDHGLCTILQQRALLSSCIPRQCSYWCG